MTQKGRPTRPLEGQDCKTVKLPRLVWEKLQFLSDQRNQPIYQIIEDAVAEKYGVYEAPCSNYIPLGEALSVLSRQLYGGRAQVSPNMAVSAIRKGKVGAERRRVDSRYQWFVDFNGLAQYCSRQPTVRQRQRAIGEDKNVSGVKG